MWVHRSPVHIDPAVQTGFTEIYGKFAIPTAGRCVSRTTSRKSHFFNSFPYPPLSGGRVWFFLDFFYKNDYDIL